MSDKLIMLVNFAVAPDQEPQFNQFYHHTFLPHMAKESPEISSIRRFEEFGVGGTLRWYDKQFLTLYHLDSKATAESANAMFERQSVNEVVKEFRVWKDKALHNFSRVTFKQSWTHRRNPTDGELAGHPFFLWQLEMKPELDTEFQKWYQNEYLPLQVAEIPTWVAASRYESVQRDPIRRLTVFEAADEAGLFRCLTDLRSAHRIEQNYEWQKRVAPAVTWQDATSFRPIYRWPD
jgi:hypothetical protein